MAKYKVAVYDSYTGKYYITKYTVDNYYDGVIETIAVAKFMRTKAVLVHDGSIAYAYDNNR